MRSCWVDRGNDADYAMLRKHGISDPYFDIRDPRVTTAYLQRLKADGFHPGVYAAWNWEETRSLTGTGFAEWVSQGLKPLPQYPDFPKVHLNAEVHDPAYVVSMLKRWRYRRPTRVTCWTMEGHQAPLFTGIVGEIVRANVDVGPQCYVDNWERIESAGEIHAWAAIGVPVERVSPFLDAAQLGAWWEGCAFTQGRLP